MCYLFSLLIQNYFWSVVESTKVMSLLCVCVCLLYLCLKDLFCDIFIWLWYIPVLLVLSIVVLCFEVDASTTNLQWSHAPVVPRLLSMADSWFAPSQWETVLLCNDVSYWLGANLTWHLQLCYQPFKRLVWKFMLTNRDFNLEISW